jgi:anti-sigma28 factor (negative regulator of flagellin synthesis)
VSDKDYLLKRIEGVRKTKRRIINIGVMVVSLLAIAVVAHFVILETSVISRYNDIRDNLKVNVSQLTALTQTGQDMLDDEADEVREFSEYRTLNETVSDATSLTKKYDDLIKRVGGNSTGSAHELEKFDDTVLNYITKLKSQTEALQKVYDSLTVDNLVESLKQAITDGSRKVNEAKNLLGSVATNELSDAIDNATSLMQTDMSNDEAKGTQAVRDQLKDALSRVQQATADLVDKIEKKKGVSTQLKGN